MIINSSQDVAQAALDAPTAAVDKNSMEAEERFLFNAHAGLNCFLTGPAGTGKSTILRQFVREKATGIRNGIATLGEEAVDVDITAPTGIAALNVQGLTIHRFAGIMLGPAADQSDEDYAIELDYSKYPSVRGGRYRICNCKTLVIDEISMLPGRQMDFLNFYFKRCRGNDQPFGGVQLIVVGDFHQLPPVKTDDDAAYDWAFLSNAWKECKFRTTQLTISRRQDDAVFVSSLMDFRVGNLSAEVTRTLGGRVMQHVSSDTPRLFTHNVQKDKWNTLVLDSLPGEAVEIRAETFGPESQIDFMKKNLRTPSVLTLKVGALVMFTTNHKESLYVNGLLGRITHITPEALWIDVEHKRGEVSSVLLSKFVWRYNSKDRASATFTQFPVCLAYGMTIHKSQGLTLDRAHCDIRAAREPGQAYVALSRVRTLGGLSLKEWPKGVFTSMAVKKFYESNR